VAIWYLFQHRPGWRSDARVGKTLVSSSMIDRVTKALGRTVSEVPVGFKWFVDGLIDGSFGFGWEESAGASFLRKDGTVWTTDKDGIILNLLAAEMTATTGNDPGEHYQALTRQFGNPVYERPVILVIYRNDHRFLLDQIVPKPGGTVADYDLVIASQPYRARASLEFKAKRVLAPLARAIGPGGRMIAIHSYGHDPGMEIIQKVWPNDNPFVHSRHDLLKEVKHELGAAGRDLNFNAYSDQRSLFRYDMHTLPSEISSSIGTSTLLAAWNAAIYVAQVEDDRLSDVNSDRRYIEATREVPVQVNGKLRDKVVVPADIDPAGLEAAALASERIQALLAGRTPMKVIQAGGGRLVNIVVRDDVRA
jgi:hypothetical protein